MYLLNKFKKLSRNGLHKSKKCQEQTDFKLRFNEDCHKLKDLQNFIKISILSYYIKA